MVQNQTQPQTFVNMAAQGDLLIQRVDSFPENLEKVDPENGQFIVAHSETGHHHVVEAERPNDAGETETVTELYRLPEEIYELFLDVKAPVNLTHKREFDTHAPLQIEPGKYRIRRQREHTPQGMRQVAD